MEEHAFLGYLLYCIIWSPLIIRCYVPILNENLLFCGVVRLMHWRPVICTVVYLMFVQFI